MLYRKISSQAHIVIFNVYSIFTAFHKRYNLIAAHVCFPRVFDVLVVVIFKGRSNLAGLVGPFFNAITAVPMKVAKPVLRALTYMIEKKSKLLLFDKAQTEYSLLFLRVTLKNK